MHIVFCALTWQLDPWETVIPRPGEVASTHRRSSLRPSPSYLAEVLGFLLNEGGLGVSGYLGLLGFL